MFIVFDDAVSTQLLIVSQVLFGYWSHDVGGFHNGTYMHGFGPFKNRTTGWMDEPGDEDPLVSQLLFGCALAICPEQF